MELYPKNRIPVSKVKRFIVSFYVIGLIGFFIPATKHIFILITPFALLLSVYLLAIYHKPYNRNSVTLFLLIYFLGYFIEVIGVETSLIFGSYEYGKALGFKVLGTPLLIGINWLYLTYISVDIMKNSFKAKPWLTIITAPLLMLIYDIVLEQVAPKMDMWSWEGSHVPIKNYVAWYIIGVLFVALFKLFKVETNNPISKVLYISQFLFFFILTFLLNIII